MSFRIGQKVVCVDDEFPPKVTRDIPALPKKGQVYTVRERGMHPRGEMIRVDEIANPECILDFDGGRLVEPFWPSRRFRPVVERKTDISIFTKLLTPKRKRELVALTSTDRTNP